MEDNIMKVCKWPDFDNHKRHEIRFVRIDNEWYAVLKDICDALGLKTFDVAQRIDEQFFIGEYAYAFDYVLRKNGDLPMPEYGSTEYNMGKQLST